MASTGALPKTILITLPNNQNFGMNHQIGQKRTYSLITQPQSITLVNTVNHHQQKLSSGPVWLPAKTETLDDDDYEYSNDDDDDGSIGDLSDSHRRMVQYASDHEQPPRKRERLTHLTADEKMYRRKLKNRIAAQTARDRKKAMVVDLEDTVRRLEEDNETLSMENTKLRRDQTSLSEENERLKKMLNERHDDESRVSARVVEAIGPAEGTSEDYASDNLAINIRSDPNILELLRQIVAKGEGATNESCPGIGTIEGEQQLDLGGCDQSMSARGYQETGIDHTIVFETAVNDHEYFQSDLTSAVNLLSPPLATSSSSTTHNLQCDFDFDSIQFPNIDIDVNPNKNNVQVPTSPNLNQIEPIDNFPQLDDDILQQALQSLGDLGKFAEGTIDAGQNNHHQSTSSIGFDDLIQNDDYNDLNWEEDFAQLFPSLSN